MIDNIRMEYVLKFAQDLVRVHGTNDPYKIAEASGITVEHKDYEGIKGMYIKILGRKFIHINKNLDELYRHVVCAHELAHAVLHNDSNPRYVDNFYACPQRSRTEKQANLFAAVLVIRSDNNYEGYDLQGEPMGEPLYFHLQAIRREAGL
jgi:Zn-dependent peptidase ImmA (M78 family)